MLWDDFDSGAHGSAVAGPSGGAEPLVHQGHLAGYSSWERDGGGNYLGQSVLFDNSLPKDNSALHARAAFTDSNMWGLNLLVPYTQFTTGNELYISFYYRMRRIGSAPFPRQSKAWISYSAGFGADKAYFSTAYNSPCESGDFWRLHLSEVEENSLNLSGTGIEGEWVRFESHLRQGAANTPNGSWTQVVYRPTLPTPAKLVEDWQSIIMRTSGSNWVLWTFGGAYYSMCTAADHGTIDVDEFYMDSTPARVEICNTATWQARTKCELQIPTAWSDSTVTATLRKGYLDNTAYVYVVNSSGRVNPNGHLIAINP